LQDNFFQRYGNVSGVPLFPPPPPPFLTKTFLLDRSTYVSFFSSHLTEQQLKSFPPIYFRFRFLIPIAFTVLLPLLFIPTWVMREFLSSLAYSQDSPLSPLLVVGLLSGTPLLPFICRAQYQPFSFGGKGFFLFGD